ncbi:hypothetical protein HUU05_23535 [candidate division KSB1 bacterium]|nr:hypothetical protein [candidate division KSB1 bacterium]
MKHLVPRLLTLFLLSSVLTASSEKSHTVLKPGATYKNEGTEPVYIIYEIPPAGEFKNETNHEFVVMAKELFWKQNYRIELEARIAREEEKIAATKKKLVELDQSISETKDHK